MTDITFKDANRRYVSRFWPVMVWYALFCFAGPALLRAFGEPPAWMRGLVALLTGAPIGVVFWLLGRLVRETDEYTRMIQTDALLAGGAVTISCAVLWGFLELFRVVPVTPLPMMMVGPGFFLAYGAAAAVQAIRRQRAAS